MCGRFVFDGNIEDIIDKYEVIENSLKKYNFGEIFPSNDYPIIIDNGVRELTSMNWGFSASYLKSLVINARCETIHEKKMFKKLLFEQRCIIPATGYYEWRSIEGKKKKHIISFNNNEIFTMAGLYGDFIDSKGNTYRGFTIITTEANSVVANLHSRMPVILSDGDIGDWLESNNNDIIKVRDLLKPHTHPTKILEIQECI